MTPHPDDRPGAREPRKATGPAADAKRTPNPDLQPDDAGTPASGQPDGGNTAEAAMKQTSKTPTEGGSAR